MFRDRGTPALHEKRLNPDIATLKHEHWVLAIVFHTPRKRVAAVPQWEALVRRELRYRKVRLRPSSSTSLACPLDWSPERRMGAPMVNRFEFKHNIEVSHRFCVRNSIEGPAMPTTRNRWPVPLRRRRGSIVELVRMRLKSFPSGRVFFSPAGVLPGSICYSCCSKYNQSPVAVSCRSWVSNGRRVGVLPEDLIEDQEPNPGISEK